MITKHNYDIENLEAAFMDHCEQAIANSKIALEKFMANDPNAPIPEYLEDPFQLAMALAVMAREIHDLKCQIGKNVDSKKFN